MKKIKMICNIIQPVPSVHIGQLMHTLIKFGLQAATRIISTIEDVSRYAIGDANTNHLLLDLTRPVNGRSGRTCRRISIRQSPQRPAPI